MSFQISRPSYDENDSLDKRLRQHQDNLVINPNTTALANRNRKEVLAKRAGAASMQRLQQEYADQGIALGGEMDSDGNIQWDYNKNIFNKVRAAGKDLSRAPRNEYAGRAQMGDAQYNQYATQGQNGNLINIESGDPEALKQAQEASAQAAQRSMPSIATPMLEQKQLGQQNVQPQTNAATSQGSNVTLPSNQATFQPSSSSPAGKNVQANNTGTEAPLPTKRMSRGEDYRRSIASSQSDSFSGGNSPLMTELNYQQAGYEDPGEAQAAMRLRNAMYGVQGDVLRNTGLQQGATSEEVRGQQDLDMLNKRYGEYNQTVMQPKLQGQMQGGNIQQSSSASQNQSQTIDQSLKETNASGAAAQQALERTSMNMLSGNKITMDGTGKIVYGTEAEPSDLEGTRFFEDVVNGKVRGVSLDSRGKIVFRPGADVRNYADEIRGRITNRGATGTNDNTLPAATLRAKGMRDLGAVQQQQQQVGNPMSNSQPNYGQVFDPKRQDSLINAAKRIKSKLKK